MYYPLVRWAPVLIASRALWLSVASHTSLRPRGLIARCSSPTSIARSSVVRTEKDFALATVSLISTFDLRVVTMRTTPTLYILSLNAPSTKTVFYRSSLYASLSASALSPILIISPAGTVHGGRVHGRIISILGASLGLTSSTNSFYVCRKGLYHVPPCDRSALAHLVTGLPSGRLKSPARCLSTFLLSLNSTGLSPASNSRTRSTTFLNALVIT